jgi:hypothetical protein
MTRDEAQRILATCRPDGPEMRDPLVIEALALVQRDPDLRRWFEQHTAFQAAMRASFRQMPVPADLAERILASRREAAAWRGASPPLAQAPGTPEDEPQPAARSGWSLLRHPWPVARRRLALAAAILLLATLSFLVFGPARAEDSFATFRARMVRSALREYRMDIVTNDMTQIRQFLAAHQAPADYEITGGLARLAPVGAGLLSWQGQRVAMVCLDSGQNDIFFLFIVDPRAVRRPPPPQPEFARVNKLATASWTQGGRCYVLAAARDLDTLRRYF